jgi:succinate dehydrogenase / fumarate reductase flavoprotein subunit
MENFDYDVVIIGSGGAALSCAINAKRNGLSVLLVTKSNGTAAQTTQAQGGINSVLGKGNDTIASHIQDTFNSSCELGDISSISLMCENAMQTIEWLNNLGVPFSRDDNNNIAQRKLGGASFPRACYSSDYTGLKILHTLYDTVIKLQIPILENSFLIDLISDDQQVYGIKYLDIKSTKLKQIFAYQTILATGGYSCVYHGFSTNSKETTADGLVSAFKAGAILENMEFIQFHPTALKNRFILISESARGEGGYLVTKDGNRFVDELLPRDIVAREIYKRLQNNEEIFLDLRHIPKKKLLHLLPQEYKLIFKFTSLEMDKDLIPIIPAAHYTMGGIMCDKNSKTSLRNLYAIGEVASNGVHGANRLGGNSLLEIVTFGRLLGENLKNSIYVSNLYSKSNLKENISTLTNLFQQTPLLDFYSKRKELGKIMFDNVGLFRSEKKLYYALEFIEDILNNIDKYGIEDKSKCFNSNLIDFLEFKNLVLCSKVIILSALERKESRGAHFRNDYPAQNPIYKKSIIIDNNFLLK